MSSELRTIESENFIITEGLVEADPPSNLSDALVLTRKGYRVGRVQRVGPDDGRGITMEKGFNQTMFPSYLRELADLLDQWNKLEKTQ